MTMAYILIFKASKKSLEVAYAASIIPICTPKPRGPWTTGKKSSFYKAKSYLVYYIQTFFKSINQTTYFRCFYSCDLNFYF